MSIRDWQMKMTAEELDLPLEWVETVIGDIYKKTNKITKTVSEIEISGFGTFMVSQNKVRRKIPIVEKRIEELKTIENPTPKETEKLEYYLSLLEEIKRRQK